jgi:class 3 adenylate cyclase/tetratricopeptide (TPR) repeat protein
LARRLVGQRRHVSVMFCDLVGSTALSDQLDPEDLSELTMAYHGVAEAAVARFGGHVAQYLGDGIVTVFGFPEAHEGDAERAVRAADRVLGDLKQVSAHLGSRLGVTLQARAGVATGIAVVGETESEPRGDTLVFGKTINLAARLQSVAQPGEIVVCEETRPFVSHCCRLTDLGEVELKGLAAQHAWRVDGLEAPGAVRGSRLGPLAGRQSELAELVERWHQVSSGVGGSVVVVGEPGIGKSRLVAEITAVTGPPVVSIACSPLQTASPLAAVVTALRQLAGSRGGGLSLGLWAADLGVPDGGLLDDLGAEPGGSNLAGSADDPDTRIRRMITAAASLVRVAGERPSFVLAEDIHWADASTLEVLRMLAETARHDGVFLVATERPDEGASLAPRADRTIVLERLGPEAAAQIVDNLVPPEIADRSQVVEAVLSRADGVPLFLEELAAAVADGHELSGIPASLQATLLSRLDRIGPPAEVAQLAAVVGRDVSSALLARMVGRDVTDDLDALAAARLMTRVATEDTGGIYSFRHALIRDAAYSSLLRRDREALHGSVAELLVAIDPAAAEHQPESLAYHLAGAGSPLEAARVLDAAGRRAGRVGAYPESCRLLERCLEVLESAPAGASLDKFELDVVTVLGNSLMAAEGYGSERTIAIWERGIALAEALGDEIALTLTLNGAAVYYFETGRCAVAAEMARRIVEIGERLDDRGPVLGGSGTLALCNLYMGQPDATIAHAERILQIYLPSDFDEYLNGLGSDFKVIALGAGALAWWGKGLPERAITWSNEALEHATGIGSRLSRSMAMMFVALVQYLSGQYQEAMATGRLLREEASLLRFPYWRALGGLIGGAALAALGDPETGLADIDASIKLFASSGTTSGAALGVLLLARSQAAAGDLEGAIASIELGLATSAELGQPFVDAELLSHQAAYGLEAGSLTLEGARALFGRAVEDARGRGATGMALRAAEHWELAERRAAPADGPTRGLESAQTEVRRLRSQIALQNADLIGS